MAIVLVTGGTGFIGSHIARRLLQKGHQVVIMSRAPAKVKGALPEGITIREGDVRERGALERAMDGVDAVINAVQFPNHPVENRRRGHTYMAIDGEGTVRQVAAAKAMGVKRFIYMSGAGTRDGQTAPWFKAKLVAERAVKESGLAYTIFQPSWVYGPDDKTLNRFATFARTLPFIPVIGNGQTKVQPVFIGDLAEVVASSLTLPHTIGQLYEVGGPQLLTMDEIIRTMLQRMGKRRPLLHNPAWLLKIATWPLTILPAPPLSPAGVDFVLMEELVDNGPLLRDFPIRLTPLSEGLSYLARP